MWWCLACDCGILFLSFIDNVGYLHASDEGWLQKAVEVKGQLHIIEELQLFEEPQPVNNIVISQKQVGKIDKCLLQQKDIYQNHIYVVFKYDTQYLSCCVCLLFHF